MESAEPDCPFSYCFQTFAIIACYISIKYQLAWYLNNSWTMRFSSLTSWSRFPLTLAGNLKDIHSRQQNFCLKKSFLLTGGIFWRSLYSDGIHISTAGKWEIWLHFQSASIDSYWTTDDMAEFPSQLENQEIFHRTTSSSWWPAQPPCAHWTETRFCKGPKFGSQVVPRSAQGHWTPLAGWGFRQSEIQTLF